LVVFCADFIVVVVIISPAAAAAADQPNWEVLIK